MQISNALNTGLEGIRKGQSQLAQAADNIAKSAGSRDNTDPAESLIELKLSANAVKASAKVVATVDQTLGKLIDTFA